MPRKGNGNTNLGLVKGVPSLDSIRKIVYHERTGKPYAVVVFRVADRMCRHRAKGIGPLCGDVWELATIRISDGRVLATQCFVGSHKTVRNASRVLYEFKRWYLKQGKKKQRAMKKGWKLYIGPQLVKK